MKPAEVVYHIDEYGDAFGIPAAYRGMTRDQIHALADESVMVAAEVVHHIDEYGDAFGIPAVYRGMTRDRIQALAEEYEALSVSRRHNAALERSAWSPLARQKYDEEQAAAKAAKAAQEAARLAKIEQRKTASALAASSSAASFFEAAAPGEPQTLFDRAIRRHARLSTPARRRAAFLRHFSRCRTVVEAAARTGIDGRTVRRWRRDVPAFAARCAEITASRRREAIENVVMAADQVETHPVYYRGAKVGEYTRRDRTLGLYLLKQADAEALRAEQRREAAAEVEADVEAYVQAEVERRMQEWISKMSASGGHPDVPAPGASSSPARGLAPAKRTSPSRAIVPHDVRNPRTAAAGTTPASVGTQPGAAGPS
jgi:hypothetical protein